MKKINKPTARKLYNAGHEIIVIPCKCKPGGAWLTGAALSRDNTGREFDSLINEFEFYNCIPELGRRSAFYIKEV